MAKMKPSARPKNPFPTEGAPSFTSMAASPFAPPPKRAVLSVMCCSAGCSPAAAAFLFLRQTTSLPIGTQKAIPSTPTISSSSPTAASGMILIVSSKTVKPHTKDTSIA
eukprot:scaffold1594_cov401-Prasinococcus_capsulatus_cf.AAC.48